MRAAPGSPPTGDAGERDRLERERHERNGAARAPGRIAVPVGTRRRGEEHGGGDGEDELRLGATRAPQGDERRRCEEEQRRVEEEALARREHQPVEPLQELAARLGDGAGVQPHRRRRRRGRRASGTSTRTATARAEAIVAMEAAPGDEDERGARAAWRR